MVCVHVYMCVHISVCVCTCMHVCACMCARVCAHVYMSVEMHCSHCSLLYETFPFVTLVIIPMFTILYPCNTIQLENFNDYKFLLDVMHFCLKTFHL